MRNSAEQIATLEQARAAKVARMTEIMRKSTEEGRATDEIEAEEFQELERAVEAIDRDIRHWQKLAKLNGAAEPETTDNAHDEAPRPRRYVRVFPQPVLEPGIPFAQAIRCLGLAQGNRAQAAEIAERRYGDDRRVTGLLKAAAYYGEMSDWPPRPR
jgi:hypothetical protein